MTWEKGLKDLGVFSLKKITLKGTEQSVDIRSHKKGGKCSTLLHAASAQMVNKTQPGDEETNLQDAKVVIY